MNKKIKIWFSDFTEDIDPRNNYLTKIINEDYDLIFDEQNPDYLIFAPYGYDFLKYKSAIKIYYTGENLFPDFNLCDYAIGFHHLNLEDRYLRFPLFAIMRDQFHQIFNRGAVKDLSNKSYFCNYIYSNARANPFRDNFFHLLSNYKKVHSLGSHLKNSEFEVGGRYEKDWMYSKLDFQSKCKFTIAFENSFCPGYTTEKILHAFISNTVPIYWGNPQITKDFNPKAFINCHDYNGSEEIIQRVKELDNDDNLYLETLNAPPIAGNKIPDHLSEKTIREFFKNIFDQEKNEAYRRPKYGFVKVYEAKLYNMKFRKGKIQRIKDRLRKSFL